jgi:DNA-binding NtrC family response regulator
VFPVRLLPLRERPEDLPVLAQHFLRRFAAEEGKQIKGFAPGAMAMLAAHPFPGNVRELENLVRHAVILARGQEITDGDVRVTLGSHRVEVAGETAPAAAPGPGLRPDALLADRLGLAFPTFEALSPVRELEAAYVKRALDAAQGNVSKAARALGLGRATMYRWMKGDTQSES